MHRAEQQGRLGTARGPHHDEPVTPFVEAHQGVVERLEGHQVDGLAEPAVRRRGGTSRSEDPAELVAHALSPARVNSVEIVDLEARSARVVVPDFQLSLAIGKEGQNARLAARLTGWRIDIRSDDEPQPSAGAEA